MHQTCDAELLNELASAAQGQVLSTWGMWKSKQQNWDGGPGTAFLRTRVGGWGPLPLASVQTTPSPSRLGRS